MSGGQPVAGNGEASFYKWGEGLRIAPQAIGLMADQLRSLAAESLQDQPVSSSLRGELEESVQILNAAQERAGGWYAAYRTQHEADTAAVETPRDGSQHKESKADVGRVVNDQ